MNPKLNAETVQRDVLASVVVFLVALPLCMGVAIASGAPVSTGLITGIVGGIVAGSLAGCPLQVSGPAAGLTVIIFDYIQRFGLEMMGLIVLCAGVFQLCASWLRIGQWFRAVSPSVIQGMLAGIGILIVASQFHVMLDDKPRGSGLENLATIPQAARNAIQHAQIPEKDDRHDQRVLMQEVGELHRQQVQITENVLEQLPDHQASMTHVDIDLSEYAEMQRLEVARLDRFFEQAQAAYAASPKRVERIRERYLEARSTLLESADSLASGNVPRIAQLEHESIRSIELLQQSLKHHELAAAIGILAIVILMLWKPLVPRKLKVIPAPLVAVIAATAVAVVWELPILSVEVPASIFDEMHFPHWSVLSDAPWDGILQGGLLVAVIASAETLLCATAVDQMHSGSCTNYDRELMGQGVGNVICGLVGALPMTGVIVRSGANVQAGGQTRLSAILHGVWLLVFVGCCASLLQMVPTACLAGVLVYTGYKLVDVRAALKLREYGWSEVLIYLATVITIVSVDLLAGVVTGIVLAVVKVLYTISRLNVQHIHDEQENRSIVRLLGPATFVRLPQLAAALDQIPPGALVYFDLAHLSYIDHACLQLLSTWSRRHESNGGVTRIDWAYLEENARQTNGVRAA